MEIDMWHAAMLFGACLGTVLLLNQTKLSLFTKLVLGYFLGYAVCTAFLQPAGSPSALESYMRLSSARLALSMLLVGVTLNSSLMPWVSGLTSLFHMVVLPILVFVGVSPYVGNSQDTLAIAIMMPIAFRHSSMKAQVLASVLPIAAILSVRGGAAGQVVLLIYLMGLLYKFVPRKASLVIGALILCFGVATAAMQLGLHDLSISQNRGALWIPYLDLWAKYAHPVFGMGPASFEAVSASVGKSISEYRARMWLHGDWIQILFEFGLLGIVLAVSLYLRTLWRVRSNYRIFLATLGLGVGMIVYSPLQFWTFQLLAAWLVKVSDEEISTPSSTIKAG